MADVRRFEAEFLASPFTKSCFVPGAFPLRLAALLPQYSGLRLLEINAAAEKLTVDVAPTRRSASCPVCQRRSTQRHSRYTRTLADLPWSGRPVRIRLQVRRFRCRNRACPRKVFAERFPKLAAVKARRTLAQREALAELGLAVGGAPGARLAQGQGLEGSRHTILRAVHATPLPAFPTPRVLGVDDWARRKSQTYGTILVDLERHRPVDLLEDRTAASLATWLRAHEGVEVIARDRAGAYAEGARQGAPDAVQVADRFHLLVNAGEALERVLGRKRNVLNAGAVAVDQALPPPVLPEGLGNAAVPTSRPAPPRPASRKAQAQDLRRSARRERYETGVARYRQGYSVSAIARELSLDRKTVRRFLRADSFPERAPSPPRPSILAPYEPYLRERWTDGCHNSRQLWRDLQARGFKGAAALVRRFVAQWRAKPARRGPPSRRASDVNAGPPPPAPTPILSPRQARWLLLRAEDTLRDDERIYRAHLLQADEDISKAQVLAADFGRLVRQRQREGLEPWLIRAGESGIPEFREFARAMRRDQVAVEEALTYEWSNGQSEGQINRLKYLKRQMYGRASFSLLKKRMLRAV